MASCCHKTSTILIIFFLCYFLCLKRKCMMHPKCFSIEAYTIFMIPMVSKHTTPNGPPSPHGGPNFCRQEVGVSLFSLSLSLQEPNFSFADLHIYVLNPCYRLIASKDFTTINCQLLLYLLGYLFSIFKNTKMKKLLNEGMKGDGASSFLRFMRWA